MRPFIAIPGRFVDAGRATRTPALALGEPVAAAVHRAGGQEVAIAPRPLEAGEAREIIERFDALLLPGGGDVNPRRYGASPIEKVYGVNDEQDAFEIALVRAAIDTAKPVLALCRGHQVLNVALGGTLHQHIGDMAGLITHGKPGVPGMVAKTGPLHAVDVDAGSLLAKALGGDLAPVGSSFHHQAVDRVGDGLRVVAHASDGIIEAVELDDASSWVIGVQWHPEDTADEDGVQQSIFDAFVAEARLRR
jgi:putative glutamine amidotransferase